MKFLSIFILFLVTFLFIHQLEAVEFDDWQLAQFRSSEGLSATLKSWTKPLPLHPSKLLTVSDARFLYDADLKITSFVSKQFLLPDDVVASLDPMLVWSTHDTPASNPAMEGFALTPRELSAIVPRSVLYHFYFALRLWFHAVSKQPLNQQVYGPYTADFLPPPTAQSNQVLSWSTSRLEHLANSTLLRTVKTYQKTIRKVVNSLRQGSLKGLIQPVGLDATSPSPERLRQSLLAVLRRNPLHKSHLPLIDELFPCSARADEVNVEFVPAPKQQGEQSQQATYRVTFPVLESQYLVRACPDLPNSQMLFHYGISLPGHHREPVVMQLPFSDAQLPYLPQPYRKRLQSSLHPQKTIELLVSPDASLQDGEVIALMRVSAMTADDIKAVSKAPEKYDPFQPISIVNEYHMLKQLRATTKEGLDGFAKQGTISQLQAKMQSLKQLEMESSGVTLAAIAEYVVQEYIAYEELLSAVYLRIDEFRENNPSIPATAFTFAIGHDLIVEDDSVQ